MNWRNDHGYRSFKLSGVVLILYLLAGVMGPVSAFGAESVAGSYVLVRDEKIVLEIRVGKPAPSTIILSQYFPKGLRLEQASPPPTKYSAKAGRAKWLLKGVKAGSFSVTMKLSRPVRRGEIGGELQYRDPATAKMVRRPIAP